MPAHQSLKKLTRLKNIFRSWIFWISLCINSLSASAYFLLKDYLSAHPDAYLGEGRVCMEPADTALLVDFCIFLLFLFAEICSLIHICFYIKKDGIIAFIPSLINLIIWLLLTRAVAAITPNCY